jgi:AraC family transcriptional regulator, alkane utilization regulator
MAPAPGSLAETPEDAMERLNQARADDVVSDALRSLRVESTVFCHSRLSAPWGFAVRAREAAAFHAVLSGEAWLEVEGAPGQTRLVAGDLVLLPRAGEHAVRDDPRSAVDWLDELLGDDHSRRLHHGGGGVRTELLCGGFSLSASPVLDALPSVVQVSADAADWLDPALELIRAQLRGDGPGSEAVVTRVADLLVVSALRTSLLEEPTGVPLEALRDPEIATALSRVHEHPERRWRVSELAGEVALSRSAFSTRFTVLVGEPPMRYVRRCRLARAAELLRSTRSGLADIALRTGYGSQVSLSKAFKRDYGVTPGAYRARPPEPDFGQSEPT